jgi:hypothetical protein
MKITINRTPEQVELIKLMASKNKLKAIEAQEAFAAFITPVIQNVLQQAPVISNFYKDLPYDPNTSPSIPLDLYYDVKEKGLVKVWSQTMPGGLATSITQGISELMVSTYNLTSAVSFLKSYAQNGRLDVVAKTLERMAQEILLKQEVNAASVMLKALADATYGTANTVQVIRSNSSNTIIPDDLLRLMTLAARVNQSWVGGTPVNAPRGITDIILSPEMVQQAKGWAYEPLNTKGSLTNIPGSEALRDEIFRSAGVPSIYGVNLNQVNEFGIGYAYNTLFSTYASTTSYPAHPTGGSAGQFVPGSEQILVALDATRDNLLRPIQTNGEGGTLEVLTDDQYFVRSEKIGFYARLREGRVAVDSRALLGLIA